MIFALAVPGFVPEKISPDADATLIDVSSVNFCPFEEVKFVPEVRLIGSVSLLKIVTLPYALVPTSFLPVASIVVDPVSSTGIISIFKILLAKSVDDVGEKVTAWVFSSVFGFSKIVIFAFDEDAINR